MNSKSEAYWAARNELVDAVRAIKFDIYAKPLVIPAEYSATVEALKEFDARNGGAPVL